jgi:GNAT superfamily N-acetyltransferase
MSVPLNTLFERYSSNAPLYDDEKEEFARLTSVLSGANDEEKIKSLRFMRYGRAANAVNTQNDAQAGNIAKENVRRRRVLGAAINADAKKYKNTAVPVLVEYPTGKDPDVVKFLMETEDSDEPLISTLTELCHGDIRGSNISFSAEGATHVLFIYTKGPTIAAFAIVHAKKPITRVKIICSGTQRAGYGRTLMDRVKELAKAAGSESIRLTAISDELVTGFYAKMGFTPWAGKVPESEHFTNPDYAQKGETVLEYIIPSTEAAPAAAGQGPAGGSSRLKKQTRRSKRHTRNHKGRKLRKLTTRRR